MFFTDEEKKVWFRFRVWYIRPEMLDALTRYRDRGVEPGGFLSAILANDFVEAASRADHENLSNLAAYACFLYNEMPMGSWGSYEKVRWWIEKGGLQGLEDARRDELQTKENASC